MGNCCKPEVSLEALRDAAPQLHLTIRQLTAPADINIAVKAWQPVNRSILEQLDLDPNEWRVSSATARRVTPDWFKALCGSFRAGGTEQQHGPSAGELSGNSGGCTRQ